MMITPTNKLYVYSSTAMDDMIIKYTEFTDKYHAAEVMTNADMDKAIAELEGNAGLFHV